ncbi:histone acetyltransferase KAT6A-like [Pomacea canaliculata]|uniref:histone acetyltransferase KAT6A-like n=1 Tax=Pomacea canaliculata TaxID=400727 RepID=UPI000D72A395|nr:histone acetyltransferase KAT6A-like [Pomacea canaliculata]
MSHPRCAEWILETIDQLRKRKARPDLQRICHMVKRRFGLSFRETEANIEKLVDSETVIKVDYKGSTSYRNAAKWKKSHLEGVVLNSKAARKKLLEAVRTLSCSHDKHSASNTIGRQGVTEEEISSWLEENFEGFHELKSPLASILLREVESGRLEKVSDGSYVFVEKHTDSMKTAKTSVSSPHSGSSGLHKSSSVPARRGRPPKNKKKLKKSFGFEMEAPELERRPIFQPDQRCDYCHQTANHNTKGVFEALLVCKDCTAKAHPSCMDYSDELSMRARKGPWQCIDCKTCYICQDAGDPDLMLFCDGCDKGFHMNCHNPQVMEKPSGKWVCLECTEDGVVAEELERKEQERGMELVEEREQEIEHEAASPPSDLPPFPAQGLVKHKSGSGLPPTPAESPTEEAGARFERADQGPSRRKLSKVPRLIGNTYPDASDWSIDDVVHFFTSAGFSEQALAFRDQEIDGKSLLLMKRSDVLTGLSIKLGPALKIHRHVQRLQMAGMRTGSPA